ncbi:hypothetical protein [Lentibacillus sp. CBA3610]|uniref:hypothetical protein n=1 Tax=Lentibacillus sp. CBA3610 TaxID=2518176 RepID=UPI001595201C|nr:hypothetical protein [Lentibacillus sp. CBA3610]QKY70590.1 hypothetical protein Len3610_14210 [Lentibacillus sp. CBA3610]
MKMARLFLIGLLFLAACSADGIDGTTYGFEQDQHDKREWVLPNSYQITMDGSFEMVSKYESGTSAEHMYFWHEPSVSEYPFELETTQEDLEKHVPTLEVKPINKYAYNLMYASDPDYFTDDFTDEEVQEIRDDIKQTGEEESGEQVEAIKDRLIERDETDPSVYTNEEYDIEPFTYMIKSEGDQDVNRYQFVGEAEEDYLIAALSVPGTENEELVENMFASLQTITYNEDEFEDNPVLDEPTHLSYEPLENLKGSYPRAGYSFEIPEAATFRHSFPVYHPYRYTFGTLYEEDIEKEHFTLRSSELVIRVEKEENARNREKEMRNKSLDDFVAFQHDHARSITYLHDDDDFNTGVFTTAIRVEFDGYEEYWFLKEVDGHVYEITFDIAFEALEYDELLDSYLNVVRSFELTGVEE